MRVVVIGAGVVGCSVALALRRRGADVTVVDRHGAVAHGSTSASCGIVRRFYSEPTMIAMAHEGAAIWADWASFLGPVDDQLAVFERPGMLFVPPRVDDDVRRIVAEMQRVGVRAELLSTAEVAARFPFFDTAARFPTAAPDDPAFFESRGRSIEGAVFEEDAGYVISPALATQNLRSAGERDGVEFCLKREVTAIERLDSGRFRLASDRAATLEADVVVNVAGPHSARVNRLAGVTLPLETRPLRREVHSLPNPLFDERGGSPVPVLGDLDAGIYCRPESGGRELIVGSTDPECDELEWVEDPDHYPENVTSAYWERQTLRLMQRFPTVGRKSPRGIAALYDVTVADWYPIVDRTDLPGYYVAIGTSGSSFKTAPVLGELLAAVVDACESGADTDREPLEMPLSRTGGTVAAHVLSRRRTSIHTTGTVIG